MFLRIFAALIFFCTPALAENPRLLNWEDLLPEGELERLDEIFAQQYNAMASMHSLFGEFGGAQPPQVGTFNVVEELDGARVRIPGFVLPFEYSASGKISEFLLVPYFGACIHVPPPPPNQMVYVKAQTAVDVGKVWDAIYVVGVLRTTRHLNELGDAAYTLDLESWEIYEY